MTAILRKWSSTRKVHEVPTGKKPKVACAETPFAAVGLDEESYPKQDENDFIAIEGPVEMTGSLCNLSTTRLTKALPM
jgi:hypothetical protein